MARGLNRQPPPHSDRHQCAFRGDKRGGVCACVAPSKQAVTLGKYRLSHRRAVRRPLDPVVSLGGNRQPVAEPLYAGLVV